MHRNVRQTPEEQRHVGLHQRQHLEELVDERLVGRGQPQLGGEHAALLRLVRLRVGDQRLLERRDAADQRVERLRQLDQVPLGDARLIRESIAALARVGGVGGEVGVVVVEEAERPVVDGQPEDRHVVGVHDAVNEADPHPVRHEQRPCGGRSPSARRRRSRATARRARGSDAGACSRRAGSGAPPRRAPRRARSCRSAGTRGRRGRRSRPARPAGARRRTCRARPGRRSRPGSARASSERRDAPSPRCRETRGWTSEGRRARRPSGSRASRPRP